MKPMGLLLLSLSIITISLVANQGVLLTYAIRAQPTAHSLSIS